MTPCGKKAKWVVIVDGMPYPVCKAHGDEKRLRAAGMKIRKAKKNERCGQSRTIERACIKAMDMIANGRPSKDTWAEYMKELRQDP